MSNSIGAGVSTNTAERNPRSYGLDVDGNYGQLGFVDGIHGFLVSSVFGDSVTVHYVKEQGAGSFKILVNNVDIVILDASTDGEPEHATYTVQLNPATPDTTSSLKLRHVDGGQVFIDGLEMSSNQPGFVYHRLARNGVGPDDFLLGLGEPTRTFLSELSPHLMILMLDWSSPTWFGVFVEQTNELLDFYQSAMPDTKFILMTHHAFKVGIETEADWYYQIARERNIGYINLYNLYSGLSELQDLGFMQDDVHMSAAGGAWFAQYVYGLLTHAAGVARTADHNRDDHLDVSDLLAYVQDFAGRDPKADLNQDGTVDAADLHSYLDAFSQAMR